MTSLSVRHLQVFQGRAQTLHDIHLTFEAGAWTCVVGPNGAGKSTLLKALAGLMPFQGDVFLNGQTLRNCTPQERARNIAWLSQSDQSLDDLTVEDTVMLGRLPHQRWWEGATPNDNRVVDACLKAQQIDAWRARRLGSLSGGERQRVLLARAMAVQAPILLMDEPVANADWPHQSDWLQTVRGLEQQGHTVISVLHDLNLAFCADKMVVLNQGRVAMHANVEDPQLQACLQAVFGQKLVFHRVEGRWVVLAA